MTFICYASSAIALLSALMVITRRNAMHALLYLILMLLSLGLVYFSLGAPFIAVLQIIIYAGAIMVLFVFVVMMLNLSPATERQEQRWLGVEVWLIPTLLTIALFTMSGYALLSLRSGEILFVMVGPKEVGLALYGPYILTVELASLVLTAGLIAGFHLAPPTRPAIARTKEVQVQTEAISRD